MENIILKNFNSLLKDNNFVKFKKNNYRLLNNNILQIVTTINIKGIHTVIFNSIPLYCQKISEDYFDTKIDGFEMSELADVHNVAYSKKDAVAIINKKMFDRLNDLIDVETHIKFMEEGLFVHHGICIFPNYLYYLYVDDYKKSKESLEKKIVTVKKLIASEIINQLIEECVRPKRNINLEIKYKIELELLKQTIHNIETHKDYTEEFSDIYKHNLEILKKNFDAKMIRKIGGIF